MLRSPSPLLVLALASLACHGATRSAVPVAHADADPGALFVAAWDLNQHGDAQGALERLRRLDAAGWSIPLEPAEFPGLADQPAFRELAARVAARAPVTPHAPVAVTIPERGLVAEGIAADPRDGTLYVGSIRLRKIVRISAGGAIADVVPPGSGGLGRVLGMKVDAARGLLWAAANDRDDPRTPRSGLHAFDLATGAARRSALVDGPGHLLNDLAVAEDGTVFATDSEAGQVLRLDPAERALVPLVPAHRFIYANGIALTEGRLLVADALGLWDVPREGGDPRRLAGPPGFPLGGIDGLSADGRTLVAVQNSLGAPRIVKLLLAPGAARVTEASVLETANPGWHLPTTGALVGGAFVYIGNSHVDGWKDGKLDPAGMEETRLFRLELR